MQVDGAVISSGIAEKPFRRHARMLFSVPVQLRHLMPGGIRSRHGISLDISEGGFGALIEGGLQVGDTVQIDMNLPKGEFCAIAVVRHSSTLRSGFEFLGLTPDERKSLASLVASA